MDIQTVRKYYDKSVYQIELEVAMACYIALINSQGLEQTHVPEHQEQQQMIAARLALAAGTSFAKAVLELPNPV